MRHLALLLLSLISCATAKEYTTLEAYEGLNPVLVEPERLQKETAGVKWMLVEAGISPDVPPPVIALYVDGAVDCGGVMVTGGCTKHYADRTVVLVVRAYPYRACEWSDSLGHELIHVYADSVDYGDHANPILFYDSGKEDSIEWVLKAEAWLECAAKAAMEADQ